ncbi:MFS transporter [Williamsia sp.]|uniref:MFS transporter n=1 Tax=Williamsia sp. TaxID=1872085 RepID=UPI001A2BD0D5|nr:MFS transporter [Williamsia sp.]MBJ7291032.1 MFS transporter [Williamsia sp.]
MTLKLSDSSGNETDVRTAPSVDGGETGSSVVTTARGWSTATWILLVVLAGALFLDGLDVSMVGVALPSMGADLGMDQSQLQWIVSGYVLGYGGFLLLGGRASDLFGRRTVFLAALAVFGVASVISALVEVNSAIVALRFIKGVAAAFTVPAGLSIITTTFAEGPARNKALSIYTVCGASGFSLGLVFGGLLTEVGWQATLLFPGPVAVLLLLAGIKVIPSVARPAVNWGHLDVGGALTSTGALLIVVYAVVRAPDVGWAAPSTIGLFAASAALLVAFLTIEARHRNPLLRLGILRSLTLVHANISAAVMFGSYVSFQFLVTLYLQDSLGWSPIAMSLGFLPAGLLVVASAFGMDRVLDRVGTPILIAIGLTAFVGGYLLFLRAQPGMGYANFLLPTILLLGLGFALCFPAVNSQATAGVSDAEQGLASGLVNTSIQIGGAIMIAVVTAITASSGGTQVPGEMIGGMSTAITVISVLSMLGVAGSLLVIARRRRPKVLALRGTS